jgi:hypothetical protein
MGDRGVIGGGSASVIMTDPTARVSLEVRTVLNRIPVTGMSSIVDTWHYLRTVLNGVHERGKARILT